MARTKNFDETEVLDKALEVFWKTGFHATSIQDLVEGMGINRASIYDTWGDKHSLYLAALKRYRQNSSSWLLEQIRSEKPAIEILKEFLIGAVREALEDPDNKGCFLVNAASELCNQDQEVNDLFQDNKNTTIKVLSELVKEAQLQGEINNSKTPEDLANFLYTTVVGLRIIAKSEKDPIQLNNVISTAISAFN